MFMHVESPYYQRELSLVIRRADNGQVRHWEELHSLFRVTRTTSVRTVSDFGDSDAPIKYTLSGPDLTTLASLSQRVVDKLKRVPGAVDVESSLLLGKPAVTLRNGEAETTLWDFAARPFITAGARA